MHNSSILTAEDALFHQPIYRDPTWLETNWFSFKVPEARLCGHIRTAFRTNLGVAASAILVWSGDSPYLTEMDYSDIRFHLPIPPQNLDEYALANGLRVKMLEPLGRYELNVNGSHDTAFDLDLVGLMPAVDSRETTLPDGAEFSHFHAVDPSVKSRTGHIDQTMAVRGTVRVRGRTYEVDFPSNRDHSWGPRPERNHGRGYFDCGYFANEFGFHVQTRQSSATEGEVTNGYLYNRGEVTRLKHGVGRYKMDGWITKGVVYDLEDEHGVSHRFIGQPQGGVALVPNDPNVYCNAGLVEWTYEGETGWGDFLWHWEVRDMQTTRAFD